MKRYDLAPGMWVEYTRDSDAVVVSWIGGHQKVPATEGLSGLMHVIGRAFTDTLDGYARPAEVKRLKGDAEARGYRMGYQDASAYREPKTG